VACSWLFITAFRGAAAGAGSLGRLGVVLMTGFSGCGGAVGFGFGVAFDELAGFHIFLNILSDFAAHSLLFAVC